VASTNGEAHASIVKASVLTYLGCAGTNFVANVTWWAQPLLLGHWVGQTGLSESAAGFIVSAEMAAMALSGALYTRIARQGALVTWALCGLTSAIVASWLSLSATGFGALVVYRALVGIGVGTSLMVSYVAVSRTADPDKLFSRVIVANLLFGVALVRCIPWMHAQWPDVTPLHVLMFALIILIVPTACLPRSMRFAAASPPTAAKERSTATTPVAKYRDANVWLLCGATIAIGIVSGMAFSTTAITGTRLGLSPKQIDSALSFGIFVALPVTIVTSIVGVRLGRLLPIGLGMASLAATIIILSTQPSPAVFGSTVWLNIAGLYLLLPYLFGAGAALDPKGSDASYVGSAFTFSGAISPFLGGGVVQFLGLRAIAPAACVVLALALLVIAYVDRRAASLRAHG
jgi:DHA1 family inner membrane transport protein